ncbi:hypothetical protein DAPPUDRAFT_47829 [Daphnia pulex]|uniref:Ubiquinone biosynthesis O-methyltransferase, mitochondrial n=1 Tax=Daphnia pulex TaxID=6669 RepID=E9G9E5_DAPPU|nr:hypothetical protein DAPPUDRAFT_47829 [Daphnia pulex]|eukprot:EFX83546.1 hypothetical protein DAPPUDRAFT_47829 [Daphnia pulex]
MLSFLSLLRYGGKAKPSLAETSEHFDQFAQGWWRGEGPFEVLHAINPIRLHWLKHRLCGQFQRDEKDPLALKGLRLMDVGCGGGLVTEPLCRMGAQVTGIDLVPQNIACAEEHALQQGLSLIYKASSLEDFAASSENEKAFDGVIAFEVIEHGPDPEGFLRHAAQILSSGGLLMLSTLNRTFRSYLSGIVAAEYLLRWVPRGTHTWQAFLTPSDLRWHLRRAGLEEPAFQGLSFALLRQEWHLSTDLSVNYFASAQKPFEA